MQNDPSLAPSRANPDPLLDREQAADYLGGVSPRTLAAWDCLKRWDITPVKVGRLVRYRRSDLDRYLQSRTQQL